jgi:hypothetical protein
VTDYNVDQGSFVLTPIGWRTTRTSLEKRIESYFDSLHTGLWSRSWELIQTSSRKEAVDFVIKLLEDLNIAIVEPEILDDPLIQSNGHE